MQPLAKIKGIKIQEKPLLALLLKVFLCALILPLAIPSVAYANTFVGTSTLTVDGAFSDWGTTGSPASGVYLFQDGSNYGEEDGSGFSGKAPDINYFWTAFSTQTGGTAPASPTNLIQRLYYRVDTNYNKSIKGQSYYIQLNLGTANPGYADHLLQVWVNKYATPQVTLVLYEYGTPYPQMRAFTSGAITGKVSNVANPYPGFTGVHDTNASGAMGKYNGTHYGVEVKLPVGWYTSTYGGAVKADGTGAQIVVGAVFTGTGCLGAVGTVKDTLNDVSGNTNVSATNTINGDTLFATDDITQIVFTTGAQTIPAGQVSGIMTIQTQDATGIPQDVSTATTVDLTSTSVTGRFDTSPSGAFDGTVTSVTIASGTNLASFYYKDTTAGTPTITAAENPSQGWTDATHQETITSVIISPSVTTDNATLVEETTATLDGTINDDGGEACQYRFEYGTVFEGPYPYNTVWTGSRTTGQSFSANVTGLSKGTKYYFVAQAKNSAGTGSDSGLSLLTKPDMPVSFSASAADGTQIDLSWTKGDGADRTMVRRKTGDYPTGRSDGVEVYFGTGVSVSDTGLTPDMTYYYKAWSEVTGSQQWSDAFAAVAATTGSEEPPPPPPPTAVGGTVYPVNKALVIAPWLFLFVILSLAIAGGALSLRKRVQSA